MINEQINLALTELLKMNFGFADLSAICSFKNESNDRIFRYEYSIDDTLTKPLKNLVRTFIGDQAVKNECVVFYQANSIRLEKKII